MHEQHRYTLALAGVGACLCLSAGIMLTAPRDLATPSVDARPVVPAEGLPRVAMPSWSEVTVTPAPAPRVNRVGAVAVALAEPGAAAPSAGPELPSVTPVSLEDAAPRVLRGARSSMPVMLPTAPQANGLEVVVARQPARGHGAVTGAFVTAGTHVGGGFRTVARTLKKVF
jgi:hypothetical protein